MGIIYILLSISKNKAFISVSIAQANVKNVLILIIVVHVILDFILN